MFGKKKRQKEWENREADLKSELEACERRVDKLSEMASQELRSPLVRMQKLLQDELAGSPTTEEMKATLNHLLQEISDYKKVIDEIFIINRTDVYKERGLFVPIDLSTAIDEVCDKFKTEAARKNLTFRCDTEEKSTYPAHPTYFRKLVSLLLDNAIKYTPEGGKVFVSLKRSNNHLILRVEDTGFGMEEEEIPKALQRFYRLEKARKDGIPGHGLGLSIAQWIAALHEAKFEVTSLVGKGSKFQITFSLEA